MRVTFRVYYRENEVPVSWDDGDKTYKVIKAHSEAQAIEKFKKKYPQLFITTVIK